ncbi:nmrA family transcriptional regulator [Aspergillus cavernicola]|uniref:NmrA family transcriptional regulator n=1 Tax=Aspergillus cavernicola TaxID=176166 RepID=A0ABR4HL03_9EURO
MPSKQILTVFGATGIQGGSVARAMLTDPTTAQQFHVRAVTRDPSKPGAQALAELGAELIKADMEDKDSLRVALQNAYGVFLVTNFMERLDHIAETRQGKNAADICKETGVKHLVWSSLPHVSKISNGKYTAALHFDSKARVDEHIRALSIPHTILHVGTYIKFLIESLEPLSTDNGSPYRLSFPKPANIETELPLIDAAADVGKFVKAIFLNPEASLGRLFSAYSRYYTIGGIIEIIKKNGVDAVYEATDSEVFKAGMGAKGVPEFFQDDLVQVIEFGVEYGFFGGVGNGDAHKLVKEPLTSLEETLKSSAHFAGLVKG